MRTTALPLALLLYALIALFVRPASQPELFPFFNWSLFSNSRTPTSLVVVEIRAIDGEKLDQPTEFYRLGDRFSRAAARDPVLMKAVTRMSYAIRNDDAAMVGDVRDIMESFYLREARQVEYDVVELTYDPVTRYREGTIASREVLASFIKS